jgi:hypothetical protein
LPAEIITAVIAASGAVILAGASYFFTKKRERDAELRREKLDHYKEFVASLSGVISGKVTPEAQRAYSRACNNLNLIAPQAVIRALQEFQKEARNANHSEEWHNKLVSRLFLEMRRDLGVGPDDSDFKVGLYGESR